MTTLTKVIDFWDSRPCNIRHSSKEVGTREYFEEVTAKKYFVEPHIIPFANFDEWKGKKVLEIGCGIGTAAQSFAEAGAIYTGVDLSEKSLQLARDRFEVFGLEGTFYKVNDEDISSFVPVEDFDLVYSFGVIHHTPNPKKLLSEIRKYMNKDSVLRVMLYASNSWKAYMIDGGLDRPEAQFGCPIANTYTNEEVRELLEGFDVTSIQQDHIFPYKIAEYKNHKYEKQDYFASMSPEMFSILEKNLGWHLLIEACII
jgi:SAM-dependent methyltransferase